MKLLPLAVVIFLAVVSLLLGMNGHYVLAGIVAYVWVTFIIIVAFHNSRQPDQLLDVTTKEQLAANPDLRHLRPITSVTVKEALTEIDRRGFRPATIEDLESFGRKE